MGCELTLQALRARGAEQTALHEDAAVVAVQGFGQPDWVIPAASALNFAQTGLGCHRGPRAGANLVTINLTPPRLQRGYVIHKRDRFITCPARSC
jgi:hypothetical protein